MSRGSRGHPHHLLTQGDELLLKKSSRTEKEVGVLILDSKRNEEEDTKNREEIRVATLKSHANLMTAREKGEAINSFLGGSCCSSFRKRHVAFTPQSPPRALPAPVKFSSTKSKKDTEPFATL